MKEFRYLWTAVGARDDVEEQVSEKGEEKDRGTKGEAFFSNSRELMGSYETGKKETGNGPPTHLPWTIRLSSNINTQEQVAFQMFGFICIQRGNYYEENRLGGLKYMRVGKLMNGKALGKDEFTREMVKGGGGLDLEAV